MDYHWTIQQLKDYIKNRNLTEKEIEILRTDQRKGAQKLYKQYKQHLIKEQQAVEKFEEMQKYENTQRSRGKAYIAGVDEVGRGPLAGPVVAAAVILPQTFLLKGLDDSKKLNKKKRELFYQYIVENAHCYSIGVVPPYEIDEMNIYQATKAAMYQAVDKLSIKPDHVLIDAVELDDLGVSSNAIVKGDQKSISIAAASIVAKVARDQMMSELHQTYPVYEFDQNSGYGTKKHLEALKQYGVTSHHRRSFLKSVLSR
ncbi:ribonuclease HII [Gracilibacillus sp. YIM 98692]|uniref:ribonuclease HII n=1 Tax=Gracilibacillus sp. YIM 98692 TaxID=2663532 RepID=UPI0013D13981|nr:ribonuclease HII [Gracilibacillus sp. YIM 98692]